MKMNVQMLSELGFVRKICIKCGKYFWTLSPDRMTCGDTDCDGYSFIGRRLTNRRYDNNEMRDLFTNYFIKDHTLLKPYPVVPRWREDVLLVNASIYDFQPHVTSGLVKPPSNPIVMSQPSIRMTDVDLVGETGRHLTSFEMLCHDSFNTEKNMVYWIDGTISRSFSFFTQAMGIKPDLITYVEKPWSGGGNAGDAMEVFVGGLEIATLVFMDMRSDPAGEFVVDGEKYSKMDLKIVDTGYGLERLSWLSYSTSTIYDFLYPDIIRKVLDKAGLVRLDSSLLRSITECSVRMPDKNVQDRIAHLLKTGDKGVASYDMKTALRAFKDSKAVYTIADHTRSILFLLSNYVIPSNVKVGYLERILLRRTFRSLSYLGVEDILMDLLKMQYSRFSSIINEMDWNFAEKAVTDEQNKYRTALEGGELIISRMISKSGVISERDALQLYDSHGLDPETIEKISEEKGGRVQIPADFNMKVMSLHEPKQQKKKQIIIPDVIETRPLYYDDTNISDFTGLVLYSSKGLLVTNQTAFYPEGGGQPCDLGYFEYGNKKINVTYVEKVGRAIVHHVDSDVPEKTRLKGHIDRFRRKRLMFHHSATHLLLAVTREILGNHVWQAGAQKGVDESRIDITHFSRLTDEDIEKIENRCLDLIAKGAKIIVRNMEWYSALDKFGFSLFQGGVPLDSKLRVVEIEGIDAEGCGGTHLDNISSLGFIKILRTETVQEGIQRIIFAAGEAALMRTQKIFRSFRSIQLDLGVEEERVDEAFHKNFNRLIEYRKQIDSLNKTRVNDIIKHSRTIEDDSFLIRLIDASLNQEELKLISKIASSEKKYAYLIVNSDQNGSNKLFISPSFDAIEHLKKIEDKGIEILNGNKLMVEFRSSIDTPKLINMIINRRKE